MKSLSSLFPLAVLGLLCCVPASARQKQKGNIATILREFPGYHLLTLGERDTETRAHLVQHFPKSNPSLVHADFDGDGHLDYAMLLKGDKSEAAKLAVLLCPSERRCRKVYELDVTGYSEVTYLRPVAAGSKISQTGAASARNQTSAVKLRVNGIQVTYFEKGKVVLYWNKELKKIEEVQTED